MCNLFRIKSIAPYVFSQQMTCGDEALDNISVVPLLITLGKICWKTKVFQTNQMVTLRLHILLV